jgi:hypothetical protein
MTRLGRIERMQRLEMTEKKGREESQSRVTDPQALDLKCVMMMTNSITTSLVMKNFQVNADHTKDKDIPRGKNKKTLGP